MLYIADGKKIVLTKGRVSDTINGGYMAETFLGNKAFLSSKIISINKGKF